MKRKFWGRDVRNDGQNRKEIYTEDNYMSCQEFQIYPKEDTNLLNSFKTDKSLHFIWEKLIFKEW